MKAINNIDPSGDIASECKIVFTATPKKLKRWEEITKKANKQSVIIESPKPCAIKTFIQ